MLPMGSIFLRNMEGQMRLTGLWDAGSMLESYRCLQQLGITKA